LAWKDLGFRWAQRAPPRCSKKHKGQQANKYEARFNDVDFLIAAQ